MGITADDYRLWFSYGNQEDILEIPYNPPELRVTNSKESESYDLINVGKVYSLKKGIIKKISFNSFIPSPKDYSFLHLVKADKIFTAQDYVNVFESWLKIQEPIRFVFQKGSFKLNLPVYIEKFDYYETGEDVGQLNYELELTYYPWYSANSENQENISVDYTLIPETYLATQYDTIKSIALRFYKSEKYYIDIMRLNGLSNEDVYLKRYIGKLLRLK